MDTSNNSGGRRQSHHSGRRPSSSSAPSSPIKTTGVVLTGASVLPSSSSTSSVAAAAHSLQLLLGEDLLLQDYGLTEPNSNPDTVAFPYAAALLEQEQVGLQSSSTASMSSPDLVQRKQEGANRALQRVERTLALVESLAVKLSRTRPEAVAVHLLRLHGYQLMENQHHQHDRPAEHKREDHDELAVSTTGIAVSTSVSSLSSIRDRADRLERQADVLDGVARRVESSLTRGLSRMQAATTKLERVLTLSFTLKSILKCQFECNKLDSSASAGAASSPSAAGSSNLDFFLDDARELTRAAASVAILEELLQLNKQRNPANGADTAQQQQQLLVPGIHVVDQMRPQIVQVARKVRQAAAQQLSLQYDASETSLVQLGTTLQVYLHLQELPRAVWDLVQRAHDDAVDICTKTLFNTSVLLEHAHQAKTMSSSSSGISGSANKGKDASSSSRRKLKQLRAQAAQDWALAMTNVTLKVRNLQRVLNAKSDPIRRLAYCDIVAAAPIPDEYKNFSSNCNNVSIFSLFWNRLCHSLSTIIQALIDTSSSTSDHSTNSNKLTLMDHVAGLYPPVRAATMEWVGRLQESSALLHHATSIADTVDSTSGGTTGRLQVLGGSAILDDAFMGSTNAWMTTQQQTGQGQQGNPQAAADTWTRVVVVPQDIATTASATSTSSSLINKSTVLQSPECKTLFDTGLLPLQQAFVTACTQRLLAPLHYMFPEDRHVPSIDEADGVTAMASPALPLLPSKYDVQRFDENIRQELSLADPREGGDVTLVSMIASCVVEMIAQFCEQAKNHALSGSGGTSSSTYLNDNLTMTDALQHDRKVAVMMYSLQKYLHDAPDKTFVAPYRPATSAQHQEAAKVCQIALLPAMQCIERMVRTTILNPLSRAINRRIAVTLAKMHRGVYLNVQDEDVPAFVQKYLSQILDTVAETHLSRFPPDFAGILSSQIASFAVYSYISYASLIRPLAESTRLHITQDLADLELALEQLVNSNTSQQTLSQVDQGKPYTELRAARQLLFWTGMEDSSRSAMDVTRALLREGWVKDLRPSTLFHYLFSFAPSLLSSPHHFKRIKIEDYVSRLVQLDGTTEEGEDFCWMTTIACCDSYQQRASSVAITDGDARIPQVVNLVGQELIRRRGRS